MFEFFKKKQNSVAQGSDELDKNATSQQNKASMDSFFHGSSISDDQQKRDNESADIINKLDAAGSENEKATVAPQNITPPFSPNNNQLGQPKSDFPLSSPAPKNTQSYSSPAPKGTSVPPNPSDIDYDPPLIQCIATLFKLHGKPVSTKLLIAGLASQDGEISPSACLRSARNAGLQCKTVHRPSLSKISKMTLPCILLLKDGRACVLTKLENMLAEVLLPETELQPVSISIDELKEDYLGYAIYAKPDVVLDRRASNIKLLKAKRWFWDTFLNFMPMYSHVFLGSIVVNLLTIAGPLFFMNVYDRVVPHKAISTLWVLAIGYLVGLTFDFIIRNLRSFFTDSAGRNADIVLASKIMQQLLSIRLDNKPDSTGSLVNNIREFESLREFFSSTTLLALIDLPFLIIFLIIVSYIGGVISIVAWAAVPIIIGVGVYLQYPLQVNTEKSFKENMQKNALLVEIVNGLETVKTSMAEGKVQDRWEKIVGESALSVSQNKRLSNFSMTFTMYASQIVSVSLIIWGIYKIKDGELTQGALIAANMLVGRAMAPLSQIASMFSRLQQSRMSLKALDVLMTLPTERMESGSYVEFGHLEHSIDLENVCFKYPNSERFALENVTIKIKPGEKVGIIGRMGSGKSTLGRLIVGLYQPTEGAIKFGGVDIRQMDTSDLRSRVGYLSQDNYLFYGTVRENIAFGVVNADDRMILRAANISGVTDFVRSHPAGFGMPVGERGMALSGGQRQSVAIARALLHDSDVLILDEPSSNMDNSSELALKQRLAGTLGNKTVILITHRLSMLDIVDRLIIVDAGKVVADGPKKAVLNSLVAGSSGQKNIKPQQTPAPTNVPPNVPQPNNLSQNPQTQHLQPQINIK